MSYQDKIVFHNLAHQEKANFLNFIYKLGCKKMIRIFRFPGNDFSLWWFSLIAEKPPLKSNLYAKLIRFLNTLETDNKETSPKETKKINFFGYFLKGLFSLAYYFKKVVKIKAAIKGFKERRNDLITKDYTIVSYFPLFDKKMGEKGIFENSYLAPFHRSLEKLHKENYTHICMETEIENLDDTIKITNKFLKSQSLFLIEEFFKLRHLFFILFFYFYFSLLIVLNLRWIKRSTIYNYNGRNYNIWNIMKEDFYKSFTGENLIFCLKYITLFSSLSKSLKKGSKVICVCEMQCWEKALYIYSKKANVTSIGYQHTIVPELLLNYFNVSDEIGNGDFINKCPLPDYLATVGKIPADLLIKYGWPKNRVFVWGAQRFESLKKTDFNYSDACKDKYFVCAFSIDNSENKKLLSLLNNAFKEKTDYKIVLKKHPFSANLKDILNELNLKLNFEIFEICDEPISRILKESKGIIVTESSCSLFALAYSIPVIVPRFLDNLDLNPLSYISDIPFYVYSSEQLMNICQKIASGTVLPESKIKGESFLKNYLYFPQNDNEYLERIDYLMN